MIRRSCCILPQFQPGALGGVAVHVAKITAHLERRGWQSVSRPDGQALVHCHAMERAAGVDVYTNHGIYPIRKGMPDWQIDANRAIFENLRSARRVVAVSRWTASQWERLVGRPAAEGDAVGDVTIIPNGIDLADWDNVQRGLWRGKLGIGSRPLALWGKTSLSDVLDVTPAVELALRRPDIAVVAPLRANLLPTAPGNFYCVGPQSFQAMRALLADCDVYLATTQENHAIQVLEAMALGKPILGYAWGGTWETVRGQGCAVTTEPGDLAGLVDGLEDALGQAEALGQAGRELVAGRYTWERQAERLERVYLDALAEREKERDPARPVCSIVIPLYNKRDYVAEAIQSALRQTAAPTYEIIVIDDGSTDGSLDVARKAALGNRGGISIQVVSQANAGVAAARNHGIRLARGRYIACLDADDRIDPLFLSRLSAALEADPLLGVAYSDMLSFGVHPENGPWSGLITASEWDFERLKRGNFIPCCNLFRKTAWQRAGGYKDINPSWEDYELWLNFGKLGWPGRRVPGPLFHYRKLWQQGRDHESHGHEWRLRGIVNSYHRDIYPPMVSVVIPCYEQSNFLAEAIDSALAQTFPDLEIIVIDDGNGPEEATAIGEIVDSCDSRVRLVTLPLNRGLAEARNAGILAARGQWIVPLDADDLIRPTFIERGFEATGLDPRLFAYSDSVLWWPAGVQPPATSNGALHPLPDDDLGGLSQALVAGEYSFPDLLRRITWPCTTLYHRDAWRQAGGYKAEMSRAGGWEDWEFAIALGVLGICGVRVGEPLFIYRQHSASQMRHSAQDRKPVLQESLRRLHPAVYRGEFPMGCCGGGGRNPAPATRTAIPSSRNAAAIDPTHTVLVRYVGHSFGTQNWTGPSGRSYRFGVAEPLQQVLAGDAGFFTDRPDFVKVPA